MCEVTKHNFKKVYGDVEHNMRKSTFISIDCEFSGLVSNPLIKNSLFDTGQERYSKLKESTKNFIILQIGITAFKYVRDWNEYSPSIYNFYIFPRSFGSVDLRFLCQSSSLEFLCSYNFDFNKVIYDGISYLNRPQEALLRNELLNGSLFSNTERSVSLDDEEALQKACSSLSQWVLKSSVGDSFSLPTPSYQERYRYLLHQEIRRRFNTLWTANEESGIVVEKVTEETRRENENKESTKLEEEFIDDLIGFSKIFNLLIDIKKPVIGHNLLLDLLFMYDQFYEPLPASLKEFKKNIGALFPTIYDTKYISYEFQSLLTKEEKFGSNALGNLYSYLSTKGSASIPYSPIVKTSSFKITGVNEEKIHEAGWDSFITGFCFIKMAHMIAIKLDSVISNLRPLTSLEHFAAVNSMKNRVNIVRASVSHVNLEGDDPVSTRPPLIFVSGRGNSKIARENLLSLFAKYGAVDVRSISPYSAVVAVSNRGSLRDILRDFNNHKDFKVEKYGFLKHSRMAKVLLWSGVFIPVIGFSFMAWSSR